MQIDNQCHIQSFRARNANIRFADDLARHVNKNFPRLSSTKYESLSRSDLYKDTIQKLMEKIQLMREDMYIKFLSAYGDYISKSVIMTKTIKKNKLGNCHESAILGEIVAKVNGIRNCFVASLKPKTGNIKDSLDHAVLYVDSMKGAYVIDPWLGFADYVPKALEKYRSEYAHMFDFKKFNTEEMYFDILTKKTPLNPEQSKRIENLLPDLKLHKQM